MWFIFFFIFFVCFLLVLFKFIFLKKEIKNITATIQRIDPKESNQQLQVGTQDDDIVALASEINKLYAKISEERTENIQTLTEVQQSMANISHDLRTPLTSIIGYLNLLSSPTCTDEEKANYLEICQRKASSLQSLVQGLFELSRLENHQYPFELDRINATAILQQELATIYDSFVHASITPDISIPDTPLWMICDAKALARIFANLLNNIIRHGNQKNVSITAKQTEKSISFTFTNNAPDLAPEDIKNLFTRFFISDKMRSKESSGIGLSIVKEFVEQTGGTITAEKEGPLLKFTLQWEKSN